MLKSYTEFCFVFQSSVPTAHAFECRMMCMAERRCAFSSCKPVIQHTVMFALLLSEILHVAMFSTWWFILTHLLVVRTHGLKPHGLLFYSWYCLHCPLSFARAATSILFVATNTCLPRQNTSFVATKYACRAKRFVTSWQACFCRDKRHVLYACPDKTFVATKLCMSQQIFVATTIFCRDKHNFAATSMLLSRQKSCFVAKNTCFSRQKLCREKIILVAVPANDSPWPDAIQACALVSTVAVHQRQQHTRAVAVV